MKKFAVLGHGVVGSGVVELFTKIKTVSKNMPVMKWISSIFLI